MPVSPNATNVIAGRYRIDGPLGRGGMAEVRAGTDLRLQRPVAVKFLLPEMAARDDIRRRFEAEARAAASFSDPHAVAVFDTGEHEGQPYIVMERLPGETLADRIRAGPVDPAWLRQVTREVLGALAAAHAVGLVHRDVKPSNILVTSDNHAKIADFGIAKSLERGGSEGPAGSPDLTGTGQLLGTPAYLPPERLDGGPATARSDLYSLGVVLYEALTGRSPFPGDTPLATARAIVAGQYQPLHEVAPGLDPALVTTVERAMATDPARRFDSATAMATALTGRPPMAAGGAPTLVDGVRGPPTAVLDRRDLSDARVAAPSVMAPDDRPRFRLPLALLVGLVFVAVLVAGLNRGNPSADEPAAAQSQASDTSAPSTSAAPATTAAVSPAASLASELRAEAGRLSAADGARAADLASSLRQVADQVPSGDGGAAATGAIISAGAWRLTGQLTEASANSAIALLSRVPGVTVVNLPSQPLINAPAPGPGSRNDKPKGKAADD